MCLLYLVEEYDGIWFAAHCLGQLSSLIIAYISWRCSDESRHTELLLIFAHVDTRHHRLVVEEVFGECLCQLRLTHTCGAEEDERGDRSLGILQSGTATTHGIADGGDCLILSDYSFVELLFKMQQLLTLALQHTRHWYSGPAAHHFCYIIGSDFLSHHGFSTLCIAQLTLYGVDVVLQRLQFAVAYLCHTLIVAFALGTFSLNLQVLNLLLVFLNLVHEGFLSFPFGSILLLLFSQVGNILVELINLGLVVLSLYCLALNLELFQLTRNLVEFLRHGVTLHTEFCCSLIHEVDCLVWQETVADVSL